MQVPRHWPTKLSYLAKTGELIHLIFNAVFTRDELGKIIGTHGTAVDITARKRNEVAYP